MSITTVIFDYGCVLSLTPRPEDFAPLYQAIGVDAAAFQEVYWRNREAYDLDLINGPAYWQGVAHAIGAPFSPQQIQELTKLDVQIWERANPVMVEWVRVLRAQGLKTAVISNISRTVGDYLRRTVKWLELFNYLGFSGELRIGKPHAAIYRVCLEALGVPAAQTLFIDDREVNIAGARAVGMHAILFRSAEELQMDLAPYGLAESLAEAKARAPQQPGRVSGC